VSGAVFLGVYFVTEGGVNPIPFRQSSTGVSSGNHLLEAMTHGFCEVIERDAEVYWAQTKGRIRIDLDTVDDPGCRYVLDLNARAGVYAAAWDMTTDIGVPAYSAMIMDPPDTGAWRRHGAYSGFGCHLSPGIALLRALTEAVQSRVTFIAGSRDDMFRRDYTSLQLDEGQRVRWQELTRPAKFYPFSMRSSIASDTFEGDVSTILSRLASVGVKSVIVVDLSKPQIGIPVVKVIVPGLDEMGEDNRMGPRGQQAMRAAAQCQQGRPS
jgi:YcaO-like protein with predicted kinase domain